MNGNLKVQSTSIDSFVLKQKRTYKNVNIHFRDEDNHTLKLSNGKIVILNIHSLVIEADSLYFQAHGWAEGQQDPVTKDFFTPSTLLELRFYPHYEKSTN